MLAPPTTAAPRRLRPTSGPLARLLETSRVRGLDRFDGETEAVQMSTCRKWRAMSQFCTRFVTCHCTFKLPHETLRNGAARRQETAPRRPVRAGEALLHAATDPASRGITTCMLRHVCFERILTGAKSQSGRPAGGNISRVA